VIVLPANETAFAENRLVGVHGDRDGLRTGAERVFKRDVFGFETTCDARLAAARIVLRVITQLA
jgi:hypothetical protein